MGHVSGEGAEEAGLSGVAEPGVGGFGGKGAGLAEVVENGPEAGDEEGDSGVGNANGFGVGFDVGESGVVEEGVEFSSAVRAGHDLPLGVEDQRRGCGVGMLYAEGGPIDIGDEDEPSGTGEGDEGAEGGGRFGEMLEDAVAANAVEGGGREARGEEVHDLEVKGKFFGLGASAGAFDQFGRDIDSMEFGGGAKVTGEGDEVIAGAATGVKHTLSGLDLEGGEGSALVVAEEAGDGGEVVGGAG